MQIRDHQEPEPSPTTCDGIDSLSYQSQSHVSLIDDLDQCIAQRKGVCRYTNHSIEIYVAYVKLLPS